MKRKERKEGRGRQEGMEGVGKGMGRQAAGKKRKGRGKGNKVEKLEGGDGYQVDGNFNHLGLFKVL